jgi:hypothetical protein
VCFGSTCSWQLDSTANFHHMSVPFPPYLCPAGAPDLLQAAGLRLLSRLWSSSGGRAYEQLRAAVIGERVFLGPLV